MTRALAPFQRKHAYQKKIVREKVRRFAYKNGHGQSLSCDIFKMLGKETRRELKRARLLPNNLLNNSHSELLTHTIRSFNMKRSKLKELLNRSQQFNPTYSLVPLAKRVIKPVNQWTLSKVENIIRHKATNKKLNKRSRKRKKEGSSGPGKTGLAQRLSRYFVSCGAKNKPDLQNITNMHTQAEKFLDMDIVRTEPSHNRKSNAFGKIKRGKENRMSLGGSEIKFRNHPHNKHMRKSLMINVTRSKTNQENAIRYKVQEFKKRKRLSRNKSIDMRKYSMVTVENMLRTREKLKNHKSRKGKKRKSTKVKAKATKSRKSKVKKRKGKILPRLGTIIAEASNGG